VNWSLASEVISKGIVLGVNSESRRKCSKSFGVGGSEKLLNVKILSACKIVLMADIVEIFFIVMLVFGYVSVVFISSPYRINAVSSPGVSSMIL